LKIWHDIVSEDHFIKKLLKCELGLIMISSYRINLNLFFYILLLMIISGEESLFQENPTLKEN